MLRVEQITLIQMGLKFLTKERDQKMLLSDSTIGNSSPKLSIACTKNQKEVSKGNNPAKKTEGRREILPPAHLKPSPFLIL